ncbi:uncharacterized protein G2W53_015814 [Senna tora]|uniref:Uncharacterized protein n=1 Tax=Senna tora TaxID=362788 RepID=A0A834WVX3_9FABA|nr:uncharacterized protein G2W53_015814 [Senna tora]
MIIPFSRPPRRPPEMSSLSPPSKHSLELGHHQAFLFNAQDFSLAATQKTPAKSLPVTPLLASLLSSSCETTSCTTIVDVVTTTTSASSSSHNRSCNSVIASNPSIIDDASASDPFITTTTIASDASSLPFDELSSVVMVAFVGLGSTTPHATTIVFKPMNNIIGVCAGRVSRHGKDDFTIIGKYIQPIIIESTSNICLTCGEGNHTQFSSKGKHALSPPPPQAIDPHRKEDQWQVVSRRKPQRKTNSNATIAATWNRREKALNSNKKRRVLHQILKIRLHIPHSQLNQRKTTRLKAKQKGPLSLKMPRQPHQSVQANRPRIHAEEPQPKASNGAEAADQVCQTLQNPNNSTFERILYESSTEAPSDSHKPPKLQYSDSLSLKDLGESNKGTYHPNDIAVSVGSPDVRMPNAADKGTCCEGTDVEPPGQRTCTTFSTDHHSNQPLADRPSDEYRIFNTNQLLRVSNLDLFNVMESYQGNSPQ